MHIEDASCLVSGKKVGVVILNASSTVALLLSFKYFSRRQVKRLAVLAVRMLDRNALHSRTTKVILLKQQERTGLSL